MSQEMLMKVNKPSRSGVRSLKIIKRYQNRKLYDTQQSCYVTLEDIAKMIRFDEDVKVIDNKTKNDITPATLTQIIFESEKRAAQYAPIITLRDIIQNGNGSISSYLAKLGAFPKDYAENQMPSPSARINPLTVEKAKPSFDDLKQSLEERVVSAANSVKNKNCISTLESNNFSKVEETPSLPNSNKSLDNPTAVE